MMIAWRLTQEPVAGPDEPQPDSTANDGEPTGRSYQATDGVQRAAL